MAAPGAAVVVEVDVSVLAAESSVVVASVLVVESSVVVESAVVVVSSVHSDSPVVELSRLQSSSVGVGVGVPVAVLEDAAAGVAVAGVMVSVDAVVVVAALVVARPNQDAMNSAPVLPAAPSLRRRCRRARLVAPAVSFGAGRGGRCAGGGVLMGTTVAPHLERGLRAPRAFSQEPHREGRSALRRRSMIPRMHVRHLVQLSPRRACAVVLLTLLAGCGAEAESPRLDGGTGKVDPAPAERVLKAYLDDDRCDLLSDRIAETIASTPQGGRALCAQGQLPVDALVEPDGYRVTSREVIDGEGIFTIELVDGGERDYVLTPGGKDGFLIDEVATRTEAEIGEPLALQARDTPTAEPVDARVTVVSLERVPASELSVDEYVSTFDKYYRARIRVRSRSGRPEEVGSVGFSLAQENGFKVAEPRVPFSDIGGLLPSVTPPGKTVSGYLFFAVPNDKRATPTQVILTRGTGNIGAKLVWKKPED